MVFFWLYEIILLTFPYISSEKLNYYFNMHIIYKAVLQIEGI